MRLLCSPGRKKCKARIRPEIRSAAEDVVHQGEFGVRRRKQLTTTTIFNRAEECSKTRMGGFVKITGPTQRPIRVTIAPKYMLSCCSETANRQVSDKPPQKLPRERQEHLPNPVVPRGLCRLGTEDWQPDTEFASCSPPSSLSKPQDWLWLRKVSKLLYYPLFICDCKHTPFSKMREKNFRRVKERANRPILRGSY